MELKKQDVGVWVKASKVTVINKPTCIRYDGGGEWYYTTACTIEELQYYVCEHNPITEIEWLKSLTNRYVLTEDELENIISNAMAWIDDTEGSINDNAKQFIQSITK